MVRIPLHRLLVQANPSAGMNAYVLMSLAYMLRSNTIDPEPITVRVDGDNYRIMDGRHRAIAALLAGRPDVLAVVEPGSYRHPEPSPTVERS